MQTTPKKKCYLNLDLGEVNQTKGRKEYSRHRKKIRLGHMNIINFVENLAIVLKAIN